MQICYGQTTIGDHDVGSFDASANLLLLFDGNRGISKNLNCNEGVYRCGGMPVDNLHNRFVASLAVKTLLKRGACGAGHGDCRHKYHQHTYTSHAETAIGE